MNSKERLVEEWIKYGKIILAVDFDDTIFPFSSRTEEECESTINTVKAAVKTGAYIMIHTASPKSRHQFIKGYCLGKGLEIDSINRNVIPLPYGNEGKPYYNWQLCDRSGLVYAEKVLLEAISELENNKNKI